MVANAASGRAGRCDVGTGDPGIGKTALTDGFLAEIAAPNGALIARGSCVEQFGTGSRSSFSPA
jgi:hypothetical protein